MSFRRTVGAPARGFKALVRMAWPNGRRAFGLPLPRAGHGYERRASALHNSAVVACVNWLARTFPEAPLVITRSDEHGARAIQPDHELAKLLSRPNDSIQAPSC